MVEEREERDVSVAPLLYLNSSLSVTQNCHVLLSIVIFSSICHSDMDGIHERFMLSFSFDIDTF